MTSNQPVRGRRAFLTAVGRAGMALGATSVFRSGASLLVPGAALLRSRDAYAKTGELLIQPSEIRSKNGVLDATLTAAPGMVQLGDFSFPGFLYNGSYLPPVLRAWGQLDGDGRDARHSWGPHVLEGVRRASRAGQRLDIISQTDLGAIYPLRRNGALFVRKGYSAGESQHNRASDGDAHARRKDPGVVGGGKRGAT